MQCSWSNSGMLSYDLTVSRRKNSGLSGFFCYSNHLWANANRMKPNAVQYAAQDSMQIILIVKCNAIQQGPYRHDVNRTLPMCSIKKCHHHFFFFFIRASDGAKNLRMKNHTTQKALEMRTLLMRKMLMMCILDQDLVVSMCSLKAQLPSLM